MMECRICGKSLTESDDKDTYTINGNQIYICGICATICADMLVDKAEDLLLK